MNTSKWIPIENELPELLETVWLANLEKKFVWLGCRVYVNDEGWMWAEHNGLLYCENNKIVAECDIDDLDVTHWLPLPTLNNEDL